MATVDPGTIIGGYEIDRLLGEGGMGAVYLARHQLLGRQAAVKVLLAECSKNQDIVGRFFDEAKASTAIQHPGIVQIFDFGYHTDGSAFIVMEYLKGESLEDRLQRERQLDPEVAKRICRHVAGALSAAHHAGIVHRDLKPENIFLVPDPDVEGGERAKILDFGIAKLSKPGDPTKTKTGMVMGTPVYMAPEQCRGAARVDARADIYSLGCVLFQLCTGRPPFNYESVGELFAAHLRESPPNVSQLGGPTGFNEVVGKALCKDADVRYQSMADFSKALEKAPTDLAPSPTPVAAAATQLPITTLGGAAGVKANDTAASESPGKNRWLLAGGAVFVLASSVVAAMAFSGDDESSASAGDIERVDTAAAAATETTPPSPAATTPEEATEPESAAAPEEPDPAEPSEVTISITSDPPGAKVRLGRDDGKVVDRTPFEQTFAAEKTERIYWITKRGYEPEQLRVAGGADFEENVTLKKKAKTKGTGSKSKAGAKPKESGAKSDKKPNKGGKRDPGKTR